MSDMACREKSETKFMTFWPANLIEFPCKAVKWLSKDYGNWFPCTKQGHAIIITDKY